MNNLFLGRKLKEKLKEIEAANGDAMISWRIPNVLLPLIMIIVSSICYMMFKPDFSLQKETSWLGWLNLFFNGSLPLIALNRISNLGSVIFKFNSEKEEERKSSTENYRMSIFIYTIALILFITILYVYQIVNSPITPSCWLFLQLFASILLISEAIFLSKNAYLLQEKLLEQTYNDSVKKGTNEKKSHLADKFGEEEV